jgi:TolA-binding protein
LASKSKDPTALKDAAIAYLRVVAHFKEAANAPHVPEAMMGAASILEELGDTAGALRLYQDVVAKYAASPVAGAANAAIRRLSASR